MKKIREARKFELYKKNVYNRRLFSFNQYPTRGVVIRTEHPFNAETHFCRRYYNGWIKSQNQVVNSVVLLFEIKGNLSILLTRFSDISSKVIQNFSFLIVYFSSRNIFIIFVDHRMGISNSFCCFYFSIRFGYF